MRKSRKRRLLERQGVALHKALLERVSEQPTEPQPAMVSIRSPLRKPNVGYQGSYRGPREISEDNFGPAWYTGKGGKAKPQKAPKRAPVAPKPGHASNLLGKAVQPPEPTMEAQHVPPTHVDTLREHHLKHSLAKLKAAKGE